MLLICFSLNRGVIRIIGTTVYIPCTSTQHSLYYFICNTRLRYVTQTGVCRRTVPVSMIPIPWTPPFNGQ